MRRVVFRCGLEPHGDDRDRRYADGVIAVLVRAQQAAVDAVRPGVTAEEVDAAARSVLAEAGLAEAFLHRTGHGIGVSVHEEPYIASGNDLVLAGDGSDVVYAGDGTSLLLGGAGRDFLFAGRLVPEKGVGMLLDAWAASGLGTSSRLVLLGDGPERDRVVRRVAGLAGVEYAGQATPSEVGAAMEEAAVVVARAGGTARDVMPDERRQRRARRP